MSKRSTPNTRTRKGRAPSPGGRPVHEAWERMTDAQRDRFTRQFEGELDPADFVEPSPQERARHDRVIARARANAKRGRPRIGKGARRLMVTVERGLLERADAFARDHGLTRAALIARGLEAVLQAAGR